MPMKVWIDQDLCTGDGLCEEIAPSVFTLLDDGLASIADIGLSRRGRLMVEAWVEGNEEKYLKALVPKDQPPCSSRPPRSARASASSSNRNELIPLGRR